MPYLTSNIPYFKVWVRKEFTHNHNKYHGEFLHANVIAVNTVPDRCLSFQVIFTGCEDEENRLENPHGGAMWARMPITALVGDTPVEDWAEPMPVHMAQPWDCSSRTHAVYVLDRATPCPWMAKIGGEFYPAKYYFTVDYTDSEIADDPAQHKQSHVLELLEDIIRDLNNLDLEFRIQELESKFSKDLSEVTFNELKELKKKQNIN